MKVKEVYRRHDISAAIYFDWRSRYGGMSAQALHRLKELEGDLSQCGQTPAESARENSALKALTEPKT
ncbi:transposase [Candidatus Rariloculus sp.]|uniref:transposase n=1 Tax=Candidatus Rariloculus sp. TaxID=3101265 RepID=UPI003D0CE961